MVLEGSQVALERITPELARRIVARDEQLGDQWHPEYPIVDELDPLRSLAVSTSPDANFTMYIVRRVSDGLAVGGFGFFGPPNGEGRVEFGYGLVPSARGHGLAGEAVRVALEHAARWGARIAAADTDTSNIASQRVLTKAGLVEIGRDSTLVFYERRL